MGPDPQRPKTPRTTKKDILKNPNLRESLVSPKVNVFSPKVNIISLKVNALTPLSIFREFLKNFKVLEIFCGGVMVRGVSRISKDSYIILNMALRGFSLPDILWGRPGVSQADIQG